ncbi:MAG: hypothetical protein IJC99_05125 [Clostridia bacterium]|nr:hypothetical protein [Clostridia bacterium]
MELYKDILCRILQSDSVEVTFPDLDILADLFSQTCYRTLQKIKAVLEDDSHTDAECFERIDTIIEIFEGIGCRITGRHDFG